MPPGRPWEYDAPVAGGQPAAPWMQDEEVAPRDRSELRQGKPQSMLSQGWDSVRQAIFGSPEREEAKEAGLGVQPTTAEMVDVGMQGLALMGGPLGVASGLPRIARATPAVRAVVRNPAKVMMAYGAAEGARHGGAEGALAGAALGGVGAVLPRALPALARGAGKAPETIRQAAGWAERHPRTINAAIGAAEGFRQGGPSGALYGAAVGAIFGGGRGGGAEAPPKGRAAMPATADDAAREAKRLFDAGKHEEARELMEAVRAGAFGAPAAPPAKASPGRPEPQKPKLKRPDFVKDAERAPEDPNAYSKGFPAGQRPDPGPREQLTPTSEGPRPIKPKAPPAADRGKEAAARHQRRVLFAKEIARTNPKMGAKIWMELDEAGEPVRMITSGQAGKLPESRKTFIKNVWGDLRHLSAALD